MTAATETIKDLDRAIERFGTYQLHDKGAVEVMDVEKIQSRLRTAGVEDTIHALEALRKHEHGAPLIHHLIMVFVEDEEWPELTTALTAVPELREAYVPWLDEERA
jgi:hypothetical protein